MEMYMLNRQHGRIILESVEHGPLIWPSVTEEGVTRLKKYFELSATEAIQADCDVKATNIILQALPPEIYSLTESSAEQAFWSQYSVQTNESNLSGTTTVEVLKELPKVSMVNSCLKRLKSHLANFDMELFTSFDQCLIDEVTEVQNVFTQMELAVEQHCEEKSKVQTKMKNVLQENDRLLTQELSVKIVNIVVHDNVKSVCMNVNACARCVTTEFELKPDLLKKDCYETLLQKYQTLEKHCITLEINNQLNTKNFQKDTLSSNASALTFAELFEINNLKAQAQAKDTVILKLKVKLNSLNGDVKDRDEKQNVEESETLNL
nr:hypothetical protein [Tanacetum cinerariifolium]